MLFPAKIAKAHKERGDCGRAIYNIAFPNPPYRPTTYVCKLEKGHPVGNKLASANICSPEVWVGIYSGLASGAVF